MGHAHPNSPSPGRFATTHWSLVLAARGKRTPGADEALAVLCSTYWYPLYAYIRRRGHSVEQAHDLTQEFFARLLEKDYLGQADRQKGKFRTFLLTACMHFLANEHDRAKALKRGGGRRLLSLDACEAENRYAAEPVDRLTPDRLYERRWALTLLEQVLARLRTEYHDRGKVPLFEALRGCLIGGAQQPYRRLAEQLGMTEAALKVAVHRLRDRYRALLTDEIARTVETEDQIDQEIRDLFSALAL